MGPENNENYQIRKKTLLKNNVPMEQLTPENFGQHFPNVSLAKGHAAFVELTAGVLYADRTLKAVQVPLFQHVLLLLSQNFIVSYDKKYCCGLIANQKKQINPVKIL